MVAPAADGHYTQPVYQQLHSLGQMESNKLLATNLWHSHQVYPEVHFCMRLLHWRVDADICYLCVSYAQRIHNIHPQDSSCKIASGYRHARPFANILKDWRVNASNVACRVQQPAHLY